jgi:tyrosyl-tRNA synthetase
MVVKLDGSDKVEVAEGSFVWLKDGKLEQGELYLEWEDIPAEDKDAIIDLRDQIDSLTVKLADLVVSAAKKTA